MKIQIVEPCGYCSGVAQAIKLAKETREKNKDAQIVVLGMLVHNTDALKELEDLNIKTLYNKEKSLIEIINEIESNSLVILTAHGHSQEVENKLNVKGIKFIDATCPFVKQAFKEIKKSIDEGHEVLYIGKRNHPEANAALSISNKVHLVELGGKIPSIKSKEPLVISQTTFSKREINNKLLEIKEQIQDATIHNGVCNASSSRQEGLLSLDPSVELIYVVGGKNSNNTKTLFNLAKEKFLDASVKMIENADEINKKDLNGLSYVAISSGASTPRRIVDEIINKIKLLSD